MACLAEGLICKDKYLGLLIACVFLKIILKERQERKQQRLQENTGSPAPASDAALDGESGGDDGAPEQAAPSGTDVPGGRAPRQCRAAAVWVRLAGQTVFHGREALLAPCALLGGGPRDRGEAPEGVLCGIGCSP